MASTDPASGPMKRVVSFSVRAGQYRKASSKRVLAKALAKQAKAKKQALLAAKKASARRRRTVLKAAAAREDGAANSPAGAACKSAAERYGTTDLVIGLRLARKHRDIAPITGAADADADGYASSYPGRAARANRDAPAVATRSNAGAEAQPARHAVVASVCRAHGN